MKSRFIDTDLGNSRVTALTSIQLKNSQAIAFGQNPNKTSKFPRAVVIKPLKGKIYEMVHTNLPEENSFDIIQVLFISSNCVLTFSVSEEKKYLSFFDWKSKSLLFSQKIPSEIKKIAVCQESLGEFVMCGKGHLRIYYKEDKKISEGIPIKDLEESKHNFIDAQYFRDHSRFVTVTEDKLCFIIEEKSIMSSFKLDEEPVVKVSLKNNEEEFKEDIGFDAQLDMIFKNEDSKQFDSNNQSQKESYSLSTPSCITVNNNHFAVGWKLFGLVSIYEIKSFCEENTIKLEINLTKLFTLGEESVEIMSLAFTSSEDYLVVAGKKRNIWPGSTTNRRTSFTYPAITEEEKINVQCYIVNMLQIEAMQTQSLCPIRELVEKGNTSGGLLAISSSFSKSHIATIGGDQYVRIWDCSDSSRFVQIIAQKYDCDLYDISIHPTAIQVALGTFQGLKVCYVIGAEELKLAIDVSTKSCFTVCYSNGGHWLAAGLGLQILVIDAATLETKYTLGNHRSSVLKVSWSDSDAYLSTSCKAGLIFVWSANQFDPYSQVVDQSEGSSGKIAQGANSNKFEKERPGVAIIGVIYDDEYDLLIVLGNDNVMEVLSEHAEKKYAHHKFTDIQATCITLCKPLRVLLIGTSTGAIRVVLWPVRPGETIPDNERHDFGVHLTEVTSIKVSHDLKFIISTSNDSTMASHKITEIYEGIEGITGNPEMKRGRSDVARMKPHEILNTLCLTYRNAIAEKRDKKKKLEVEKKNIEDLGTEKEAVMRKIHETEMEEIRRQCAKRQEDDKFTYRKLQEQYETECKKTEAERHRLIEENQRILEMMDEKHKKEQRAAFEENNKKIELLDIQQIEFRTQVSEIQKFLSKNLGGIEAEYQGKYEELNAQHQELLEKIKADGINFDDALEQCEHEYENEIESNKNVVSINEKKATLKQQELQKEEETLRKEIGKLTNEITLVTENINIAGDQLAATKKRKQEIDKKVFEMETILSNQLGKIAVKNQELKGIKTQSSHLDDLKCVLDYKIETMSSEKAPLEKQIKQLEHQVQKMNKDLDREAETKKKLDEEIKSLDIETKEAQLKKKNKSVEVERLKRKLMYVQHDLIMTLKDPIENWLDSLKKIQSKYFGIAEEKFDQNEEATLDYDKEYAQIKDELVLQKKWLEENLVKIRKENVGTNKEKGNIVKVMESENSELILDAKRLRNEYEMLTCRVKYLDGKYKSITKLTEAIANGEDMRKEIKKHISPSLNKKFKAVPVALPNRQTSSKRSVSILNFYKKFIKDNEEEKRPNEQINQVGKLVSNMQMNKEALESQNIEIAKLQVNIA